MATPDATALFAEHRAAVEAADADRDAAYERSKQVWVKADAEHAAALAASEAALAAELAKRRAACAAACCAALRPVCKAFEDDDTRANAEAVLAVFREQAAATREATGEGLGVYHLGLAFVDLEIERNPGAVLAFGDQGSNAIYQGLFWPGEAALKARGRPAQYDALLAVEAAAQRFSRSRGAQGLEGARRRYEAWRSTTSAACATAAIAQIRADEEGALTQKVALERQAAAQRDQHKRGLFERMLGKFATPKPSAPPAQRSKVPPQGAGPDGNVRWI